MANRSNRRRQNPLMSKCEKHEKAIGSRRANSPSWPCIETMLYLEAEYTCAVGAVAKAKGLAMRSSPYTDVRDSQLPTVITRERPIAISKWPGETWGTGKKLVIPPSQALPLCADTCDPDTLLARRSICNTASAATTSPGEAASNTPVLPAPAARICPAARGPLTEPRRPIATAAPTPVALTAVG